MQNGQRAEGTKGTRLRWGHAVAALLLAAVSCLAVAPAATASPTVVAEPAATHAAGAGTPAALPEQPAWSPLIDQLYQNLLHRAPDPGGLTYWGNVMAFLSALADEPAAASYISGQLVRSPGSTHPLIDAAYQHLLGRSADQGGLSTWSAYLRNHSLEGLWSVIAGTPEFARHNPTAEARVTAVYQTVLGRAPDSGGLTFWAAYLGSGTAHLRALVTALARSNEYATHTVAALYQQALLRTPDAAGLQYWAGQIEQGSADQLTLLATLAGSAESVDYGCDHTAGAACLLPYPNNLYTEKDNATATGKRLALKPAWTPTNANGVHIDTQELNRSDGFSPGAAAIVQVPGLSLTKTPNVPTVDDPSVSQTPTSSIEVFDTTTGQQWPVWAELDQFNNPGPNPTLFVRPATNYIEGHTYVVVLRNLKSASGAAIAPSPVFKAYLDGTDLPGVGGFEARKPYMTAMLKKVAGYGVSSDGLYLAWEFTVASSANITGRLVHIRDDAFQRLGGSNGLTNDAAPAFTVTSVTQKDPNDPKSTDPYPGIARVVDGTFQVPSYLTGDGGPGTIFNTGPDGLPQYSGTSIAAPFRCIIPATALATPGIPSVYGHGLFGGISEVTSGPQRAMATQYDRVYCATPEIGMSSDDEGTAAQILLDLSKFDELADRTQQGILDELFLGRLLNSPNGFDSDAAFQNGDGQGVITPHEVTYDGNSQGGILGGVVTAVATDWTRAVLGVTAMNFSTLMDRSDDFGPFFAFFNVGYPNRLHQVISVDLIQSEWDRSEPDGYADHLINNLLPDTPEHHVLLQLAYGDHQVSNWASDVEVRTIARDGNTSPGNLKAECPTVSDARKVGEWPLWNVTCLQDAQYPYDGSAAVYLDSGSNPPPLGNTAPPAEDDSTPTLKTQTHDPHSDPRDDTQLQAQKDAFLRPDGEVTQACDGPCVWPLPDPPCARPSALPTGNVKGSYRQISLAVPAC